MSTEDLERVCLNCSQFFVADGGMEEGVCLRDEVFAPYIDILFEDGNFTCCLALYGEKKFDGTEQVCADFDEIEFIDDDELETISEDEIITLYKTRNMDSLIKQLYDSDWAQLKKVVSSLDTHIRFGNENAYRGLLDYYNGLPAAESLDDVHHRVQIVNVLASFVTHDIVQALVTELEKSPSNNVTRQLYTTILNALGRYPHELVYEPVWGLLKRKKFATKIEKRICAILEPRQAVFRGF
ncbi:MAG: hypothetical protein NUK65_02635 [Firmicutes bacterium]|nr:hypothetical protein [Bacillota bacterium]